MNGNDCAKFEDLMVRHVHGGILPREREELERHLSGCRRCDALYRDASEADRLLRSLPPAGDEPPPWLHAKIMANLPESPRPSLLSRWGISAWTPAAAAAGAALAVLLLRGGPTSAPPRVASVEPEGMSAPVPETRSGAVPAVPKAADSPKAAGKAAPAPAFASARPEVDVIREVRIYLYLPTAQRVAVTGDFNGWDENGVDLKPVEGKEGMWETELRLQPGAYAYNFIVDGDVLVPDPESPNQMPDGFGGTNSILLVKEGAPA